MAAHSQLTISSVAGLFLSCLDVEVHYGTACKSVTKTISRLKKKKLVDVCLGQMVCE